MVSSFITVTTQHLVSILFNMRVHVFRGLMDEISSLTKLQSDMEIKLSESRMKILSSENMIRSLERQVTESTLLVQGSDTKLNLSQHQVRLYEGEVKNLRDLLKSYDTEFCIGTSPICFKSLIHIYLVKAWYFFVLLTS